MILQLKLTTRGAAMRGQGAVVSNHVSWLDIFVLNARKRIYFVAKSEVAGWPGIGWLARATGTLFVKRKPNAAGEQVAEFKTRLSLGHELLFFPEGTSSDGMRVLPFKSTLFASFLTSDMRDYLCIQPVTVNYTAPKGQAPYFYGWWGDMELGPHIIQALAAWPQGFVEVVYHEPVKVADFTNRKDLAAHCENVVRGGLAATTPPTAP